MNIKTQECGGAQQYAQNWIIQNKDGYLPRIDKQVEKLKNTNPIDYTDPQTWIAITLNLSLYQNRTLKCTIFLLDNNILNLKTYSIHLPHADSVLNIKDYFTNNHFFASLLVQNIYTQTPNLESLAFFQVDNYALLMLIESETK